MRYLKACFSFECFNEIFINPFLMCRHHHHYQLANLLNIGISKQFPLISVLSIVDPIRYNSLYVMRRLSWWTSSVYKHLLPGSPFQNLLCLSFIFHPSYMQRPIPLPFYCFSHLSFGVSAMPSTYRLSFLCGLRSLSRYNLYFIMVENLTLKPYGT